MKGYKTNLRGGIDVNPQIEDRGTYVSGQQLNRSYGSNSGIVMTAAGGGDRVSWPVQYVPLAFNASATVPTRIRLTAHTASRLNQLRDTNVSPRYR